MPQKRPKLFLPENKDSEVKGETAKKRKSSSPGGN